jgi:hypothetical protein
MLKKFSLFLILSSFVNNVNAGSFAHQLLQRHKHFCNINLALKTDMISLLNTLIEGINEECISAEICFNEDFGLQITAIRLNDYSSITTAKIFKLMSELRYYMYTYDYSGLYLAPYILLEKGTARVNDVNNRYHSYICSLQTKWEYGATGGYQQIVFNHLLINPCVYLGNSGVSKYENHLPEYGHYGKTENELVVMVRLFVGWKF